jgi:hypothetical protein
MHCWSQIRRKMSLVLTLTLLLWVGAGPEASAISVHPPGCIAGTTHSQHGSAAGITGSSHHCCPPPADSASSLQESFHTASVACQQSCCKLGRQPAHAVACLTSDNRHTPDSTGPSAKKICGAPSTTFEVTSAPVPPFHKAVFDLKADLRI